MKTVTKHWNGRELRETVRYNNKIFRFVTGLCNGGGGDCVYMWTDQKGWSFVIDINDVGKPTGHEKTSYVSGENVRQQYAEQLNTLLKKNITKLFD